MVGIEVGRAHCRRRLPVSPFRLRGGFTIPPWPRFPKPPYHAGRPDFPGPVGSLGLSLVNLPNPRRGSSAGSHTPRLGWFTHHFVPSPTSAFPGSVSGHRADHGTAKYPESLCLIAALPLSGRRRSSPARTLLPGYGSYGLMRQSRSTRPKPRSSRLCRLLPASAAGG